MNLKKPSLSVAIFRICTTLLLLGLGFGNLQVAHADSVPGVGNNLTGVVFRDFNSNGEQEQGAVFEDTGVSGVTVTAFCTTSLGSDGIAGTSDDVISTFGPVQTDGNGVYTIVTAGVVSVPAPAQSCRLEFSNLPTGFASTAHGQGAGNTSGTSVQFANPGTTNLSFGVSAPSDYCQNNPYLATNCWENGDPLANGSQTANSKWLVGFPYNASGTSPATTEIATGGEVGTTWGLAYDRYGKRLFAAAFLKRHAGMGPEGPGAIYVTDMTNPAAPGATSLFVDLVDLGVNVGAVPTNATRGLPASKTTPSVDSAVFGLIGKTSLGDMDISDDGQTLFVVNLFDKRLYRIAVASPNTTPVPSTLIPDPGCTNGQPRPFATKFYRGKVYVGVVCSAENGGVVNNLSAHIYPFDPVANSFGAATLSFGLNYTKGCTEGALRCSWYPWTDTFANIFTTPNGQRTLVLHPQPILSDIEFEATGAMILGFMDRAGHQFGLDNRAPSGGGTTLYTVVVGGDILRTWNDNGAIKLENNAVAGPFVSSGVGTSNNGPGGPNTNQGPSGGEFYWADHQKPQGFHSETTNGGLAQMPGAKEVVVSLTDPIQLWSGGASWFSNINGAQNRAYEIFAGLSSGQFGKANGVGDIELLCDAAPIELGNRVWEDSNRNGVQDPGETPLAGVTVQLFKDNVLVGTAVTNNTGEYYFAGGAGPDGNLNDNVGLVNGGIQPNQSGYEVRIVTTQSALTGYTLTNNDTDNSPNGDSRDSDFVLNASNAIYTIPTTGAPGENDHTIDAGFAPPVYDRGDLPDTTSVTGAGDYQTLNANGGPSHRIVATIYLGARVDDESDGQPTTGANGDDLNPPTADDEDGVTVSDLTLVVSVQATVRVTATNNTGSNGLLYGFIDFNGDGDFDDANEFAQASVPTGSNNAVATLNFGSVPNTGVTNSYARFRFSTDDAASLPTGPANDGEVEDYPVVIQPLLSLGNRVWRDEDNGNPLDANFNNGLLDNGESGIANVTLQLLNGDGSPYDRDPQANGVQPYTVNTDATGTYTFTNLLAGAYRVQVLESNFANNGPLNGFVGSSDRATSATPDNNVDNDDNGIGSAESGVTSGVITLSYGGEPTGELHLGQVDANTNTNYTVDFGFWRSEPDISLKKYTNGEDADTPTGPTLELGGPVTWTYDIVNTGNITLTNITLVDDKEGNISITCPQSQLAPGGAMTCLLNGIASTIGQYANTAVVTGTPTLQPTRRVTDTDPSHYRTLPLVNLGNLVWHDANNDGLKDPNEQGIDGVSVQLFQAGQTPGVDSPIASTSTANGGIYNFTGLTPGNYFVYIPTPPNQYPRSSTPTDNNDNGEDNDDNGDQPGGPGAAVRSPNVNLAVGAEPTNDGDGSSGDLTVDFGFFAPVSVGDYTWYDDNNNGRQDNNEPPVPNIKVRIFTCGGQPAVDVNGNPVPEQTTDNNGLYLFTNLPPGEYYVVFDKASLPSGVIIVPPNQGGDDALDSDADANDGKTACTPPIPSGGTDRTLDMGMVRTVTVGDRVWFDNNNNGIQDNDEPGVENVTVRLFMANGQPANDINGNAAPAQTTNGSGNYLFTNLPPGAYYVIFDTSTLPAGYVVTTPNAGSDDARDSDANPGTGQTAATPFLPGGSQDLTLDMGIIQLSNVRVGDYVWVDRNINGAQDAGEPGVPGVTVTLFNAANNQSLGTDVTDSSGFYLFENLPPGQYYVVFDLTTLPTGYRVTTQNANGVTDDKDSDADPTSGRSGNTPNLTAGQEDLTLDMGIYILLSLGNLVWEDPDNNGLVDSGEEGLANIPVRLYQLDGTLVATTTTNANGNYRFVDLLPGDYYVEVDVPSGFTSSTGDLAGGPSGPYEPAPDPDNDIDNDDNGTADANAPTTLRSAPVTLSIGDEPTGPDNNDPHYNPTVDFGVTDRTGQNLLGSLGDRVWIDQLCDGIQEPNNTGVANVTVNLYKLGGTTIISTTTTNANGAYRFNGLEAGDYVVEFILPQGNYTFTQPLKGTSVALDSDADPADGQTAPINLSEGETDLTWDAGLCVPTALPPDDEPVKQTQFTFLPFVTR